jgi:hypothetical protein
MLEHKDWLKRDRVLITRTSTADIFKEIHKGFA